MTPAIVGLVGVVIGGLITGLIQERQRRVAAKGALRLSARVMRDELSIFVGRLELAIRDTDLSFGDPKTVQDTWRDHRAALESLPWEEWDVVQVAVKSVVIAEEIRDGEADEAAMKILRDVAQNVRAAITVLDRYV